MEPTNALDRTGEPAAVGGALPDDSRLLEDVKSLWHEFRGLVHDRSTLAALETRLAGESLVTMVAAGVMVAALLVSAWLGLMGAVVLVGMRASMVGRNVRGELTSPAMMLLAGGIGFAAGHFPKRPDSTPGNTERPRAARKKLFERALKLIVLARILSRAFPSAEVDPAIRSGLSSQAPAPRYRSAAT